MTFGVEDLKGSIPPIITPFNAGEVDYEAYARLVEYQLENGTHGILVNGTTSEPSTLTVAERNKIVDTAIETVNGRVPVVAATGSQSLAETRALTEHAADKADALLIVTPYYIKPPQRGLVEYFVEATKNVARPWMVYHIPGRAVVNMTVDTFKAIRERSPQCVGMKHAVNDLGFVSDCLAEFGPDFKIFVGLEALSFPMMAVGACGLMNAVGNLRPQLLIEMCDAIWAGDLEKARQIHHSLYEINESVFFETNPIPMKYMMKRMGLIERNEHRLPMMPATPELEKRLDTVLKNAGLI